MKKWFKISCALLVVAVLTLAMAGCGKEAKQTAGEPVQKLVFGTEPSFAPFEFVDEQSNLTGFDIELIQAIGEATNVEIVPKQLGFATLIPALKGGNIDCAVSGMTITDERKESVDFSHPYYESGLRVIVRTDNETIKSFDDLEGKKIGVQIGTTGAGEAETVPNAEVTTYDTNDVAFMALENGAVDAMIQDFPVAAYYISQGHNTVKMVGDLRSNEYYGIAVPKDKPEVLAIINEGLMTLKANGKYAELYKKWFGNEPPEDLPGEVEA